MKLVYLANIRIPTEKAHGVQIMKMCEAFSSLGREVELIAPKRKNHIRENPFNYYSIDSTFNIKKIFTLDLIRFGKLGFYLQSLTFALASIFYVIGKNTKVYSRDIFVLYFVSFFKKDIYWETHTAHNNFMVKRVYNKSKGIVSITKGLKEYYENKFGKRDNVIVSPDAVDLKEFDLPKTKDELRIELGLPLKKKILGYIGKMTTMGESKGVEEIIQAFPEIIKENQQAFLLLVGANKSEADSLSKILKDEKVSEDNFKIVLHTPRTEAIRYMKASDALIMNYPNTEHYAHFMSPLKMFEYMASGAVVVTTDLPSIREVLDERTAVFVRAGDSQDFIDKINSLFKQADFISRISRACLEKVKEYTWKDRASNILKFIEIK